MTREGLTKEQRLIGAARREMPPESRLGHAHIMATDSGAYDVFKLIDFAQELVVRRMPTGEALEKIIDQRLWSDRRGRMISPRQIYDALSDCGGDYQRAIMRYPDFAKHFQKLRDADPDYPVIFGERHVILIDGAHRILRAW